MITIPCYVLFVILAVTTILLPSPASPAAAAVSRTELSPVRWEVIGDSITYLNDHLDETYHRVSRGYMTRVRDALPLVQYFNRGGNGWTAGVVADNLDLLDIGPAEVYSIFIGTNDWFRG